MSACYVCKNNVEDSQFISVPGGDVHMACFYCPVCQKNLANERGYLPFKGNFLCGVKCRAVATRNPDVLLSNTKHWGVNGDAKGGWAREDGKEGEGQDAAQGSDATMQPKLAKEAAAAAAAAAAASSTSQ